MKKMLFCRSQSSELVDVDEVRSQCGRGTGMCYVSRTRVVVAQVRF